MHTDQNRILTTHAGSLPRPDSLARLMYDVIDGIEVDHTVLQEEVRVAVADAVRRQREIGLDAVSDGDMHKTGWATYVREEFTGFEGHVNGVPLDVLDAPDMQIWQGDGVARMRRPMLTGPMEPKDPEFMARQIAVLSEALGPDAGSPAFLTAVTPGHLAFNFVNHYYPTHDDYIRAAAEVLRPDYEAVIDAGYDLQLDSPNFTLAFHMQLDGSDFGDDPWARFDTAIEALNEIIADLPRDRLRMHVCWANYNGPHHKDKPLRDLVETLLRVDVRYLYLEAASPRHAHEWAVWKDVALPDDKALIVGVVDPKSNQVEHPELVAERIERYARIVGRDRVVAAPDCGFSNYVGMSSCPPSVAWMKLQSLVEGAQIASSRLW